MYLRVTSVDGSGFCGRKGVLDKSGLIKGVFCLTEFFNIGIRLGELVSVDGVDSN